MRKLGVAISVRRRICATYLMVLAALSLMPMWLFPPSISQIFGIDKLIHVGLYGILGALLRWAVEEEKKGWTRGWILPLAGAGYGWLMECCQYGFSGGARSFSWGDAGANLLGVMLFWGWAGQKISSRKVCPVAGRNGD